MNEGLSTVATVYAPYKTPLEKALATDAGLQNRILLAALRHTRTPHDAEDLAQTAMLKAIGNARETGEPKPPKTFFMFVGSFLNSLGATKRRSLRRNPAPADYDETNAEHTKTAAPDAHAKVIEVAARHGRDLLEEQLHAHFESEGEDGRIPLGILKWVAEDVKGNEGLAEKIGCSVPDIERAKKRMAHHGSRLRRALEAGDQAA